MYFLRGKGSQVAISNARKLSKDVESRDQELRRLRQQREEWRQLSLKERRSTAKRNLQICQEGAFI